MTFSLNGAAHHVLRIGDQWENRARIAEANFRTTTTPECSEFPHLRKFPYPVQKLIVDQLKLAHQNLADGEEPAGEMPDELICPVDCLFYRQYQLPCRHLWHYELVFSSFQENDWNNWAELFEDGGFEIYETTTKINVSHNEDDDIEGPDRHVLQMWEVLEHIKDKYYEIAEHTAEWTVEERNPKIERWLLWLNKLTGPIRKQGVEEAMRELENEAESDEAAGRSLTRKRRRTANDEGHE